MTSAHVVCNNTVQSSIIHVTAISTSCSMWLWTGCTWSTWAGLPNLGRYTERVYGNYTNVSKRSQESVFFEARSVCDASSSGCCASTNEKKPCKITRYSWTSVSKRVSKCTFYNCDGGDAWNRQKIRSQLIYTSGYVFLFSAWHFTWFITSSNEGVEFERVGLSVSEIR